MKVKVIVQPAGGATFQGRGPEDDGKALIKHRRQTRQMMPFGLRSQWGGFHT
jgi:hypothetical protein